MPRTFTYKKSFAHAPSHFRSVGPVVNQGLLRTYGQYLLSLDAFKGETNPWRADTLNVMDTNLFTRLVIPQLKLDATGRDFKQCTSLTAIPSQDTPQFASAPHFTLEGGHRFGSGGWNDYESFSEMHFEITQLIFLKGQKEKPDLTVTIKGVFEKDISRDTLSRITFSEIKITTLTEEADQLIYGNRRLGRLRHYVKNHPLATFFNFLFWAGAGTGLAIVLVLFALTALPLGIVSAIGIGIIVGLLGMLLTGWIHERVDYPFVTLPSPAADEKSTLAPSPTSAATPPVASSPHSPAPPSNSTTPIPTKSSPGAAEDHASRSDTDNSAPS